MTWNPESTQRVEQVNLTATVASRSNPTTGLAGLQTRYRSSDGNTYGELEFPEVAPLVFPALDQLAAQTSVNDVKKKNKMAEHMSFIANYWDKRATAKYVSHQSAVMTCRRHLPTLASSYLILLTLVWKAMTNPDSVLARVPQEKFRSRYADPNNPAASGSLISFVSGGHLIPGPNARGLVGGIVSVVGQAVRGEPQGSEWARAKRINSANQYSRGNSDTPIGLISTPVGVCKKILKKARSLLFPTCTPKTT